MKSYFRAAVVFWVLPLPVTGCSGPTPDEREGQSCTRTAPHLLEQEFRKYAPFQTYSLQTEGGVADLHLSTTNLPVTKPDVSRWVASAAKAVATYYGRFPIPRVSILVVAEGEDRIESGKTFEGRWILIKLGRKTTTADLRSDWTMTHEMFHLAFPDLDRSHLWMEEGMATYLEPLARARIGNLTPEEVWKGLVDGIPKGMSKRRDRGLDQTETWGATYWGGALFWLMADLEIRELSGNHRSLDDAMRGILDAGGTGSVHWNVEQVLETGDRAAGFHVLRDLYARMGNEIYRPNLEELWQRCGFHLDLEHRIIFDTGSPQSGLRRSMTAPTEPPPVKLSGTP